MITPRSTIQELQQLIANGTVSAQEVVSYYHQRLTTHNESLNCALEIFDKDDAISRMQSGPLHGIPGLIKDNICQEGQITSAASKILETYRAPYDATIVQRLNAAGSVSLGRGNMDEFAMGSSGEYSAFGLTRNPWSLEHAPGGSSSGPAAAVAAGLVPWAIGSETGGSVRQPASFCGLVGLYPTYGRFSRSGLLAFCSSTDQPGPLTRTVYDNALIASHMSGQDAHDTSTIAQDPQDFTVGLDGTLPQNLRVGVIKDALESDGVDKEVKAHFEKAIAYFEKNGATIEYVSLPNLKYGISVYFVLSRAEAASNLSRYDGSLYGSRVSADALNDMYITTRHDKMGSEVQRRLVMGNYVLSAGHRDAYYGRAQQVRDMIRQEYADAFKSVNVLLSPTASTLPFKLGEASKDPLSMYMGDYFTVPNCITGLPGVSLPCGFADNGLPIGFQVLGPRLSENLLYKVAHAFEQAHDYHTRLPESFAE